MLLAILVSWFFPVVWGQSIYLNTSDFCNWTLSNPETLLKSDRPLEAIYGLSQGILTRITSNDQIDYERVQLFLHWLLEEGGKSTSLSTITGHAEPIILSQKGFLSALGVGLLVSIFFPVTGCILCSCRQYGHCRSGRHRSRRGLCLAWTFVTVIGFLLELGGLILFIMSVQNAWSALPLVRNNLVDQFHYTADFINSTGREVNCIVQEVLDNVNDEILFRLKRYPDIAEEQFFTATGLKPLFDLNKQLELANTHQLPILKESIGKIIKRTESLNSSIQEWFGSLVLPSNSTTTYTNITELISGELRPYGNLSLESMTMEIGTELDTMLSSFTLNVSDLVESTFKQTDSMKLDLVQKLNDKLVDTIKFTEIVSNMLTDFDLSVQNICNAIQTAAKFWISDPLSKKNLAAYTWIKYVLAMFSAPVVLILLWVSCGLSCGAFAYNPDVDSADRSRLSENSGRCLLTAAATCFVFSALFQIGAVVFFAASYFSQNCICKPIFLDESSKAFDLMDYAVEVGCECKEDHISIPRILAGCRQNEAAYKAFGMSKQINLDETLQKVRQIRVDVKDTWTMEVAHIYRPDLEVMETMKQAKHIIVAFKQALNHYANVLLQPPEYTIGTLTELLNQLQPMMNQSDQLNQSVKALEILIDRTEDFDQTYLMSTLQEVKKTISLLTNININIDSIYDIAQTQDDILLSSFQDSCQEYWLNLTDDIVSQTTGLVNRLKTEVSRCRPLYEVYKNVGLILCHQLLDVVHGFWLTLGWCVVSFIFVIVGSCCLSEHFLRTEKSEEKAKVPRNVRNRPRISTVTDGVELLDPTPWRLPRVHPIHINRDAPVRAYD